MQWSCLLVSSATMTHPGTIIHNRAVFHLLTSGVQSVERRRKDVCVSGSVSICASSLQGFGRQRLRITYLEDGRVAVLDSRHWVIWGADALPIEHCNSAALWNM